MTDFYTMSAQISVFNNSTDMRFSISVRFSVYVLSYNSMANITQYLRLLEKPEYIVAECDHPLYVHRLDGLVKYIYHTNMNKKRAIQKSKCIDLVTSTSECHMDSVVYGSPACSY